MLAIATHTAFLSKIGLCALAMATMSLLITGCEKTSRQNNTASTASPLENQDGDAQKKTYSAADQSVQNEDEKLAETPGSAKEILQINRLYDTATQRYNITGNKLVSVLEGRPMLISCVRKMPLDVIKIQLRGNVDIEGKSYSINDVNAQTKFEDHKNPPFTNVFLGVDTFAAPAFIVKLYAIFQETYSYTDATVLSSQTVGAIRGIRIQFREKYFNHSPFTIDSLKLMVTAKDITLYEDTDMGLSFGKGSSEIVVPEDKLIQNAAYQNMIRMENCDGL